MDIRSIITFKLILHSSLFTSQQNLQLTTSYTDDNFWYFSLEKDDTNNAILMSPVPGQVYMWILDCTQFYDVPTWTATYPVAASYHWGAHIFGRKFLWLRYIKARAATKKAGDENKLGHMESCSQWKINNKWKYFF